MQHLALFFYFFLSASGFAGITVSIILMRRLRFPVFGWIVGVIGVFTIWLMITLVVFYVENIIVYPLPTTHILEIGRAHV